MKSIKEFASKPIILESARVRRTYRGGKNIERWHGEKHTKDSDRPEEWVASVVEANNFGFEKEVGEGLSTLYINEEEPITLKELIHKEPEMFLGDEHIKRYGENVGFLVKLIDSSERLSVQVHPDTEFAKKYLNSDFGKTEAWYMLGTQNIRDLEPSVRIGFKQGITKKAWADMFRRQDIPNIIDSLHTIKPETGDVYLIQGGLPHAIGAGCFLIEIQEPTDYTFRVEKTAPSGIPIPDMLIHQGVGFKKILDCFHYETRSLEQTIDKCKVKPTIIRFENGGIEKQLIGAAATDRFSMNELEVTGRFECTSNNSFSSLIVLSGEGVIEWEGGKMKIKASNLLFLPFSLCNFAFVNKNDSKTPLKIIRCFPPN